MERASSILPMHSVKGRDNVGARCNHTPEHQSSSSSEGKKLAQKTTDDYIESHNVMYLQSHEEKTQCFALKSGMSHRTCNQSQLAFNFSLQTQMREGSSMYTLGAKSGYESFNENFTYDAAVSNHCKDAADGFNRYDGVNTLLDFFATQYPDESNPTAPHASVQHPYPRQQSRPTFRSSDEELALLLKFTHVTGKPDPTEN